MHLVETLDEAQDLMAWLGNRRDWLAVDVETTGLNAGRDHIRLFQVGDTTDGWALDFSKWSGLAAEIIHGYQGRMVAHNLIFDSKMLKAAGIEIPQRYAHDSLVMAHILDPMRSNALKTLSTRLIDPRAAAGERALKELYAKTGWNFATVPVDHPTYWFYSTLDTVLTAPLADQLWSDLTLKGYRSAYEIELGAIHVLRDAELAGMTLDNEYVIAAKAHLLQELDRLEREGMPCNPNSEAEIVRFIQGRGAGHLLIKKTEKGNIAVDDEVLKYVAAAVPEAELIRQARKCTKLMSSYIRPFAKLGVPAGPDVAEHHHRTGEIKRFVPNRLRLHCNVRPNGAKTGRMSITDPALQTLPRGCAIRDAFIPAKGHRFVISDYAQMELRVMASYANEETMLAAFARGEDLHNLVTDSVYGDGAHKVKQKRGVAKNAGFAKIYGAGIEKFAVTCGISFEAAKDFLTTYDAMFPGVKRFQEELMQVIAERAGGKRSGTGYVETIHHRRLPVPLSEGYKGTNYLIQGGCAQVLKLKLVEMSNAGLHDYIRLPVHDEVLLEVPEAEVDEAVRIMDEVMPDKYSFPGVVLEAEAEVFDRWGDKYAPDYGRFLPAYFADAA